MNRFLLSASIAVVLLCGCSLEKAPAKIAGVDRFEVVSINDAYGGVIPPGAGGSYQVITGIIHGTLDPGALSNAQIVDIDRVPTNDQGLVEYSTDVVILRPKNPKNAKRVLFYDVVNRGHKIVLMTAIGGGALIGGQVPESTFPSLLSRGYTFVWSGWQGDVPQTGDAASLAVGTAFPVAQNLNGTAITGVVREEFVSGVAANTIELTYPPASLTSQLEVKFTARQTWNNIDGKQDYAVNSVPVTHWNYSIGDDGKTRVIFSPPASIADGAGNMVPPDKGTIYQFVYRAKDPVVNGMGFAVVRDLIDFLRSKDRDLQGNLNPLNDMKLAVCAEEKSCNLKPDTNFDVALGHGISQSGRFLKDFLYQGFNRTLSGAKVFEGIMPIIPAARRTWTNYRFSQIGRWSKQHEDHFMPGDQFPFAYNVIDDPVSGKHDGLLKNCLVTDSCPKIMQIDGSFEWWGGRASLVVTDGAGRDLTLPDNVRYYLVPGTGHGSGGGVSTGVLALPAAGSLCQMPDNPVAAFPVFRALVPALEKWVVNNIAPPASQYPTVASGQLVPPNLSGFPDLENIVVPSGAIATPVPFSLKSSGVHNQLYVTDYSVAEPVVNLTKQYQILVPKVNSNGNEISGIQVPDVSVPLATYTGWNLRGPGYAQGESCAGSGGAIPFAASQAAKAGGSDTRSSLEDLYTGRADYQAKVEAAANSLVAQGYLLQLDAINHYSANAKSISSALIPAP